jgi:hypothetical protein
MASKLPNKFRFGRFVALAADLRHVFASLLF